MPEYEPDTFAIYLNFIYTNNVATSLSDEPKTGVALGAEYDALCKLYVLCEKLCDIAAKNVSVEAILAAITYIYAGTPHHSLVRRLMADMRTQINPQCVTDEHPKELLVDLVISLRKDRSDNAESAARRSDVGRYLEELD